MLSPYKQANQQKSYTMIQFQKIAKICTLVFSRLVFYIADTTDFHLTEIKHKTSYAVD